MDWCVRIHDYQHEVIIKVWFHEVEDHDPATTSAYYKSMITVPIQIRLDYDVIVCLAGVVGLSRSIRPFVIVMNYLFLFAEELYIANQY